MILLIQTLELLSSASTTNIEIVALSFQALELLPYFYKHCNSHLIALNTGILAVFFYTLACLSYPSKRWNFGPTFMHIDFFLSYPSKPLDSRPISVSIGILILSFQTWNSGRIPISTGVMILFNQTLEFSPYFYTYWNIDLIL